MRPERILDLAIITPELIAELGLQQHSLLSYRCDEPGAVQVPIGRIVAPQGRRMNTDDVKSLLRGISAGASMPAVVVVHEIDDQVTLLDGLHRYRVSDALGFRFIPCRVVSEDEAVGGYGYWRRVPES